jgi:hypothetical protein
MRYGNYMFYVRVAIVILLGLAFGNRAPAQTGTAILHGQVTDPSGGIVKGATVQITAPGGQAQTVNVDADGIYLVRDLAAGSYSVTVTATGFAPFTKDAVDVAAGRNIALNVALAVAVQTQQVTVQADALTLDTNPSNNAGAVVLSETELDALPDDPDELQADLEAMAGPGAGPNGGQMYIDGFTAGTLPPKSSIREIRINSNPFSAEFDQVGFGRIEIFTKAGGQAWHGSVSVNANQAAFNSRNPVATSRGDFQSLQYNANVGGGLGKKMSLFFNADYRSIANQSVINADIVDIVQNNFVQRTYQTLNPLPQSRLNIGPRLDYQITNSNTLSVRYQFERNATTNSGVGNFTLPVQGSNTLAYEDQLQVTDSQYIGTKIVYETRFQYLRQSNSNLAANLIPSVNVPGAFTGGGSGNNIDLQNRYELQSYTSVALSKHFLKFGARIRESTDSSNSNSPFFGGFQFASLTAYQTTVQGLANGMTMATIIAQPGCNTSTTGVSNGISNGTCGPTQYSITAGSPLAYVSMIDAGPFIQDDWRLRPNITLSYGLRFETQNHIHDHMDWAPRLALAWGIGGGKNVPKTVLRAGWGMFYSRFAEANILQALRENGTTEQQLVVANPTFYCGPATSLATTLIGTCPTPSQLTGIGTTVPTIYQIAPNFHAPYMMQSSLSLERQITKSVQASITYSNTLGFDQFLERNSNAPVLPGTEALTPATACPMGTPPTAGVCGGAYPNNITENIYQYSSTGKFRQNQLTANVTIRPGTGKIMSRLTINGFYVLNYANSTPNGFVEDPYDVLLDYGHAGGRFGTRNIGNLIGTIRLPWGLGLSPSMQVSSGAPYTVTIGKDLLGTSIFNQRPGFVSSVTCPTIVVTGNNYCTSVGTFNSVPTAGEPLVPVNSLIGPSQFTLNLRLTKTFIFGKTEGQATAQGGRNQGAGGAGGAGGPGPGAGGRGGGGFAGGGGQRGGGGGGGRGGVAGGRYSFTLSANARNIFNNVNLAAPVGNLTSPLFGRSEAVSNVGPGGSVVANRQIYLQGTFSF